MNDRMSSEMAEATRLTRAGRLVEATELIQRLLQGGRQDAAAANPARADGPIIIDQEAVTLEDMENDAPRPASGKHLHYGNAANLQEKIKSSLQTAFGGLAARFVPANENYGTTVLDPLPEGASFITASFSCEAGTRTYKLYIPANRNGEPLPLVVMLHGCTQSPDDFAAGTRMNALAEEHGCFVAYPAQSASANVSKCWNWFTPEHQQRDGGEPALIAGITRRIMRDHPVDPSRVYIAGLSAGGAAAAIMGAAYPDLYTAIGVHSGLACGAARDLPSAFAAMSQGGTAPGRRSADGARIVPTIVFHGDQDNTVHPCNGDEVIAQSKAAAIELQTTQHHGQTPGGHAYSRSLHTTPSGQALCEQWTIHGAGHAWAGGSPTGSYTDPQGPDATREMLRFFLEHRHQVAEEPV